MKDEHGTLAALRYNSTRKAKNQVQTIFLSRYSLHAGPGVYGHSCPCLSLPCTSQHSPGVGPDYRFSLHPLCGPLWPSSASEVD